MNNDYGKIKVGVGTSEQHELKITEFVRADYKDNRVVSFCAIEDGSFVGAVENPPSTGRNTQSTIWLSKESMIGLISTAMLYFNIKGEDMDALLKETVRGEMIEYTLSDNLKPL